jgi:hypothetical protein
VQAAIGKAAFIVSAGDAVTKVNPSRGSAALHGGEAPFGWRFVAVLLASCSTLAACAPDAPDSDAKAAVPQVAVKREAIIPSHSCTTKAWNGREYKFCNGLHTWHQAKDHCAAVGMKLARVDSAAEDDFIEQNLSCYSWVGGSVPLLSTKWSWQFDNGAFYDAKLLFPKPLNGAYNNWDFGEPLLGSCLAIDKSPSSHWDAESCLLPLGYVCENPDRCPTDPLKTEPGVCGCNRQETDGDLNGVIDCIQATVPGEVPEDSSAVLQVGKRPQADTTTAAISFLDGSIGLADYYCLSVDRSDKRVAIFDNPSLAASILAGDIDADLVPDTTDQCPDTPPLTPTNDAGCTETCEIEFTPEEEQAVREGVGGWQIIRDTSNTDCATTTPDTPEMVAGYINNTYLDQVTVAIFFQFTRPACPVRLRIEVSTTAEEGWPLGGARVLYFEPGPADFGGAFSNGQPVDGAMSVILRAPEFDQIYQNLWTHIPDIDGNGPTGPIANPPKILARAQAVYGDGKTSAWSNFVLVRAWGARQ